MDLSFTELAILASASGPKDREVLARDAVLLHQSTKFDVPVALAEIKNLIDRRYLAQDVKTRKLEITAAGHMALLNAIPVIENFRAATANVYYRVVR